MRYKAMAVPLYKDPACEDIWERDRTLDSAIDAIRGLPSAQPELSDEESKLIYRIGYEKGKLDGVKYCTERLKKMNDSFCGADMRGGQDIPEEE